MAKPNKKIRQRLSDFDFSGEDNHVAIVGKAANGKPTFLVTKSLHNDDNTHSFVDLVISADSLPDLQERLEEMLEGMEDEDEEEENGTEVNMPLADLLRMVGFLSEDEAQKISESVVKSAVTLAAIEDDDLREEFTKALSALVIPDSASGAVQNSTIQKEDNSMSDDKSKTAPEDKNVQKSAEDIEALEKSLETSTTDLEEAKAKIEELTKAAEGSGDLAKKVEVLQKAADDHLLASFNEVAKTLESLGADEDTGKILKGLSKLEGGDKVLEMLTKGAETIKESELLDEFGREGSDDTTDEYSKLEGIAKGYMDKDTDLTYAAAMVKASVANPKLAGNA